MADIPRVTGQTVAPAKGPVVFQNPGETAGAFGEASAAANLKTAEALQRSGAILAQSALERAAADHRLDARQDAITRGSILDRISQELDKAFLAEKTYSGFSSATRSDGAEETGEDRIRAFRQKVDDITSKAVQNGDPSFKTDDGFLLLQEHATQLASQYHSKAVDEGLKEGMARFQGRYEKQLSGEVQKVFTMPGRLSEVEAGVHAYIDSDIAPGLPPSAAAKLKQDASENLAKAAVGHYLEKNLAPLAREVLDEQTALGRVRPEARLQMSMKVLEQEVKFTNKLENGRQAIGVLESLDPGITKRRPGLAAHVMAGAFGVTLPAEVKPLDAERKVQVWAAVNGVPMSEVPTQIWNRALALEEKERPTRFGRTPAGRAQELAVDREFTIRMASGESTIQDRIDFLGAVAAIRTINPQTQQKSDIPAHWNNILEAAGFNPVTMEPLSGAGSVFDWIAAGQSNAPVGMERPGSVEAAQGSELRRLAQASAAVRVGQEAATGPSLAAIDARDKQMEGVGTTFFKAADLLTGFKSTSRNIMLGIEPVEEAGGFGFDPKTYRAAKTLRENYGVFLAYVAEAMNSTPRFADAFRVSIEKRLEALNGDKLFESPDALRASMAALDISLERMELDAREKLTRGGAKSLEAGERKQSEMFLNKISAVRRALAAPPRVRNLAEAYDAVRTRGLKAGDPIIWIDPSGGMVFKVVPQSAIGR